MITWYPGTDEYCRVPFFQKLIKLQSFIFTALGLWVTFEKLNHLHSTSRKTWEHFLRSNPCPTGVSCAQVPWCVQAGYRGHQTAWHLVAVLTVYGQICATTGEEF